MSAKTKDRIAAGIALIFLGLGIVGMATPILYHDHVPPNYLYIPLL